MRLAGGEETVPAGIHTVLENMDKMGLTSRIDHPCVLRQWSIYPVNTMGAVPKIKEDKFISGAT